MKLSFKIITAAVALLLSTTAFASNCPNLAGTYMCPGDNGDVETTVSQAVVNGVTVYTVADAEGSYDLIADGQTRVQNGKTNTGNDATIKETNTCEKQTTLVSVAEYSEVDPTGQPVASFKMKQVASRDASGGLALTVAYSENGGPDQVAQGVCPQK